MTEENDDDLVVIARTTVNEIITSLEEIRENVKEQEQQHRQELFKYGQMAGSAAQERDVMHAELLRVKAVLNFVLDEYNDFETYGFLVKRLKSRNLGELQDTLDNAAARLGRLTEKEENTDG